MKTNNIYCGDCVSLLNSCPAGSVDLAFADPPFNIGYVYDKYRDDRPDEEYVEWSRQWMAACQRVLKADGSFYIAIGDEFAADIRILGRELGLHLRNWIIWYYSFGQHMSKKFSRSHAHILYFTKHKKQFTFNDHLIRHLGARHVKYNDARASSAGKMPDDVWEFSRVCGTFKERAGFHSCQMPEALLMRIILASSNVGEIVLDPFSGSGTTAVSAKKLGRQYMGIDISENYVKQSQARVDSAASVLGGTSESHRFLLIQFLKESKISISELLKSNLALNIVVSSMSAKTGHAYSLPEILEMLKTIDKQGAA